LCSIFPSGPRKEGALEHRREEKEKEERKKEEGERKGGGKREGNREEKKMDCGERKVVAPRGTRSGENFSAIQFFDRTSRLQMIDCQNIFLGFK
jgi:hypothetical protein